ncbi:MAG: quinone-dependent dihydroorotate dehydrogenase [Verrucomicrobiota bacterium]
MSWIYRKVIRPSLFTNDAEEIHGRTLHALGWASRHEFVCDAMESFLAPPALPVDLFGLRFPNPIGLAAGMDKFGEAVPAWAALGFGFTELGGVTWHGQPGNPAPRVFRAIADEAIVNRMGFNNDGAEALAEKLRQWRTLGRWPKHPVGINLGKSKITPLDQAAEDYANSFRVLRDLADFFVVNVSSPNTPNLRQLQDKVALDEILTALRQVQNSRPRGHAPKPILVKVAPDLSFEALDEILQLVGPGNIASIVATNTTITRPTTSDIAAQKVYAETGGLSGRPLRNRSTEVIRHLYRQSRGKLPIIGVGGIFTAEDAWEKITAGASLLQVYTGLVYQGPAIAKALVSGLQERLAQAGLPHLQQAVGIQSQQN